MASFGELVNRSRSALAEAQETDSENHDEKGHREGCKRTVDLIARVTDLGMLHCVTWWNRPGSLI